MLRNSARPILGALKWCWALPLTACGLPVWLIVFAMQCLGAKNRHFSDVVIHKFAIIFIASGSFARWLLAHHPFGAMDAIAIGCCVFARDADVMQRTWSHELVHVDQAMRWGVFFPLAYAACSGWCLMHRRCAYQDNYFEVQARHLE